MHRFHRQFLALCLLFCSPLLAQQNSDDPTPEILPSPIQEFAITRSAFLQEKGELQVTAGLGIAPALRTYEAEVELGLTDSTQLAASIETEDVSESRTPGYSIQVLHRLRGSSTYSWLIGAGVEFDPSGDGGGAGPILLFAKSFGRSQMHFGYSVFATGTTAEHSIGASWLRDCRGFVPTLELLAKHSHDGTGIQAAPGLTFRPSKYSQFLVAYPLRIAGTPSRSMIKIVLTYER